MPIVIPASKWDFDPQKIDTGCLPNHGRELTTERIIESLGEISQREEMVELNKLIMESGQYVRGRGNVEDEQH